MGCVPMYLTGFQTNDTTAYDKFRCLKDFNSLARYHNNKLKKAIKMLRKDNPNVIVTYGDYYTALFWVFQHASLLGICFFTFLHEKLLCFSFFHVTYCYHILFIGFDKTSMQKSCCGTGGDYNFNIMKICGFSGVPVCYNPHKHISWDGIHLTQKTYQFMAHWLIHDISPKFRCEN